MTRDVKYLKEVVVAKDPPVVHVFDVVEHGRRFYRTLAFSSEVALSLVSRPPSGVSESTARVRSGQESTAVFLASCFDVVVAMGRRTAELKGF